LIYLLTVFTPYSDTCYCNPAERRNKDVKVSHARRFVIFLKQLRILETGLRHFWSIAPA